MTAPPSRTDKELPPEALPPRVAQHVLHLAEHNQRPVSTYVYRPDAAAERARTLKSVLPEWGDVFYAVKANSFPPVLRALADAVDGFEITSTGEGELVRSVAAASGSPCRLIASGPGKSDSLLGWLIANGVEMVNVESVLEMQRAARLARLAGQRVQVTVRVNPPAVELTPTLRLDGTATQFGIAAADVPAALAAAATLPDLDVIGFHFHVVCNNIDAADHAAWVKWCLDWSARMADAHGLDLGVVDVGGGMGVGADDEQAFDVDRFGDLLRDVRPPPSTRVVFEPGRWLVDTCGLYATEVIDVKRTRGTWFVVLRGGINHFLRPAFYQRPHHFAVIPINRWPYAYARPEVVDAPVTLVGELCTPEDVLVRSVPVNRVRVGDVIVFPNTGSYGWELALHEFLGHPRAERSAIVVEATLAP